MALAASSENGIRPPLLDEARAYFRNMGTFGREDWIVYIMWVGMMLGLVFATGGFLVLGHTRGVRFPAEAWLIPIGAFMFAVAIAVDTIGHRTVYKEEISKAEGLVHAVTIFFGVGSCVLLCAAYGNRSLFGVPAAVMTIMSFVYSLVDEVFHWVRYATKRSDRIEMASHALIFLGHGTMMGGWWMFYLAGFPGVAEVLALGTR